MVNPLSLPHLNKRPGHGQKPEPDSIAQLVSEVFCYEPYFSTEVLANFLDLTDTIARRQSEI